MADEQWVSRLGQGGSLGYPDYSRKGIDDSACAREQRQVRVVHGVLLAVQGGPEEVD